MTDGKALEARMDDLEQLLKIYQRECNESKKELGNRLDRIMKAALGDTEMGVVGFIEQHRRQHDDLLEKVNDVLGAQTESRVHRTLQAPLPAAVATLRAEVSAIQQTARDADVTFKAYRRLIGWTVVGINAAWGIAVAVWKVIQ